MMSGSASSGRYITGVTYSRPLLRPRWCTRTMGAPSKFPPTLPSLARNSAMVFVFQSSGSLMSDSWGLVDELGVQELCRPVERRASFIEQTGIGLEDMRNTRGDIERHRYVR